MVGFKHFVIHQRRDEIDTHSARLVTVIDTKTTCFFCLKEFPQDEISLGSLYAILRLLKITACNLIEPTIQTKYFPPLNPDSCSFSANLCRKCVLVSKHLSDTIKMFEVIRLQLSNRLEALIKIFNDEDKPLEDNLKEPDFRNCDDPNLQLIQMLRKKIKKSCKFAWMYKFSSCCLHYLFIICIIN